MPQLAIPEPCDHPAKDAAAYNQQAISLARKGRWEEAVACLTAALHLRPDCAEAHLNLGNVRFGQRRYHHAVTSYRLALCFDPNLAEAYSNLANTLSALGRYGEAVSNCQQALRLQPNHAEAHVNLGNAYQGLEQFDPAAACYRRALELKPDLAEARVGLGGALTRLDQLDEAIANLRAALRIKPDFAAAHCNLALAFTKKADWDQAVAEFRRTLRLEPNSAEVHQNLGTVLAEQRKLLEAEECFQQAVRLKPDYAKAHWSLALARLVRGDFEQGWPEYEWRWRLQEFLPRKFEQPEWDGSSLSGRTILLHAEQGLGDMIQFIRYAAVVKRYGGRVVVQCQEPLVSLLASCPGIDETVALGSVLPAFDIVAPLLSLPRIIRTTLSTVPADIPYLIADTNLQCQWQQQLGRYPGFKIGIAWQGNQRHPGDERRSFPLAQFAPLAQVPGVRLISVQKGFGTEQLDTIGGQFPVIDLGRRLDTGSGAFMDTAAIMKSLDLVIVPDTSVAHLAGALGVPVWVALPYMADWRWLLDREDSPWYPTMRLFRQSRPGDWDGVFARVADELGRRTSRDGYGAVAARK